MSGFTPEQADITFHADTSGVVASLRSVLDVLAASRSATETFLKFFPGVLNELPSGDFDLSDDGLSKFFVDAIDIPASRASDLVTIEFNPSKLFLEFITALVANERCAQTTLRHGWPILSVGCLGTPTVAEAGRAASLPRGGAA